MNLPPPFEKASALMPDTQGSISLIDAQGKPLARIPLSTAFELSTVGRYLNNGSYGDAGYYHGHGDGGGFGYGSVAGFGEPNGSGRSKIQ